jgi:D-sedoheptulose 7-phosphate isomerase
VITEPTAFLYPFIDAADNDVPTLLADLAASARAKLATTAALRVATLQLHADALTRAGEVIACRLSRGARIFTFGNGGSATDAQSAADLFRDETLGQPCAALSLVDDPAALTALANDVGFDLVFSRQIIAHARRDDIAIGFSTSGDSVNVRRALDEASRRGLLTVGLCGYEGGAMASGDNIDHCFVVPSDSVHRIQETQAALVLELWSVVQRCLREGSRS